MTMTQIQAIKLAGFIQEIRPDWDFHGIKAALWKNAPKGSAASLAIAMITAAATDAETPAGVVNSVYWPAVGPSADADRAIHNRNRTEQIRSRRISDEAAEARRKAATPDQVRQIREAVK